MKNKGVRLTQKTAKALIQRELNLSASRLKTERAEGGVYIYKMTLGRFEITVENDWFERNGLYVLEISSGTGEAMRLYYDPDTLEENCEAEDKNRAEIRKEHCEGARLCRPHGRARNEAAQAAPPFASSLLVSGRGGCRVRLRRGGCGGGSDGGRQPRRAGSSVPRAYA